MTLELDAPQDRRAGRRTLAHTSVACDASTVVADAAREAPIDTGWMRLLHRHAIDSRDDDVPLADRAPVHDAPRVSDPMPTGADATPRPVIQLTPLPGTKDDGERSSMSRASTFLTAAALALCALMQLLLIDVLVAPATGHTRPLSARAGPSAAATPSTPIGRAPRDARAPAPVVPDVSRECRAESGIDRDCTFE